MYGRLFRLLPGPLGARILIVVLLLATVIVALFGWVFPAIAPLLPINDGVVDALAPPRHELCAGEPPNG